MSALGFFFDDDVIVSDPNLRVLSANEPAPLERAHFVAEFFIQHNISANQITRGRVLLTPLLWLLLYFEYYESAVILLLLLLISDLFDGIVAKTVEKRSPGKGITNWGKRWDPISDKLLIVPTLLFFMPWVPGYVQWSIAGLEMSLVLVRPLQKFLQARRGIFGHVIGANSSGQTKATLEGIMLLAYLLQVCRPEYIQLICWIGALGFGLVGLVTHIRNALQKPETLH